MSHESTNAVMAATTLRHEYSNMNC